MKYLLFLVGILPSIDGRSQDLPYREIPAYPSTYTAANVAARMVDGVGFRYYWATEGLREQDLAFKPSTDARTTLETITHIFDLSSVIINSVNKVPNIGGGTKPVLTFVDMRRKTLENLEAASKKLKSSTDKDLEEFKMVFKNATTTTEFPFWNEINGPIADALWHVGQVVTFRRSSGNPFNDKVSVLQGKIRE